ncbi:hypothetical protein [Streptomyces sp. SID3343]|uniref:hypothetical protein n=1 Tax=Streptomyces sp. SID3343 TaxID=2690260 RepID=UPI001367B6FA|nr:hypothetical protein [Streptomyces sp. SID3343]MYW04220.1 hypothetical protein [Streptomyces sp. SID3343]
MYREGDYVEPVDEKVRAVRHPGQILMAQPLPTGLRLTVQPFDGGLMWAMPSDSVRRAQPPPTPNP